MTQVISGPGVGLQRSQLLYPYISGGPFQPQGTPFNLAAGQALPVPAGLWNLSLGKYSFLQFPDPVSGTWLHYNTERGIPQVVQSNGQNLRVFNPTGCPIAAVVTVGGTAYVQASTTVAVNTGNSTWQAIVGGQLSTTVSVSAAGAGYGIAPLVFAPPPQSNPGVQASFVATISSGTVSGITTVNQGAGYTGSTITLTIVPNPYDPNFLSSSITANATAVVPVTGAGVVAAVICTNPGVALSATPTLSISGAGASAAATPLWMSTVTSLSASTAGGLYSGNVKITQVGGVPTATAAYANPFIEMTGFTPRNLWADATMTVSAVGAISIRDPGLFLGTVTPIVLSQSTVATVAVVAATQGGATDTITMQQL